MAIHKEGSFIYIHSDHSYTMTHNFCVHLKNNYRILLFNYELQAMRKKVQLYKKKPIHTLFVWECDELTYLTIQMSSKSLASFVEFPLFCFTQYMKHLSMCSLTLVVLSTLWVLLSSVRLPVNPFRECCQTFSNIWIDRSPHPSNCSRVNVHD